ncbi:MAG: hypothetical protein ACLFUI_01145 [Halanaerobiales bacterium]
MGNFFRKMERLLMNLVIVTLILVISIQIVMRNDAAYQRLREIESTVRNVFQSGNLQQVLDRDKEDRVVEVSGEDIMKQEGLVIIDLIHDYSLPQVWLVKNGKKVANFSEGIVRIPVQEGDLLTLDCKFYHSPLWFEITGLSADIRTWHVGQQFRISSEEVKLGVVDFYDKL